MTKFVLGLLVGVCLIPACVYLYLRQGMAPVATSASPLPFERSLTRMALRARIAKDAPQQSPIPVNDVNLGEGAKIYREHCAVCHGLIGQPATAISKGMFPHPPQLFEGKGVTDDPSGESYWKAAYGIRLTGMPSFLGPLTDEQVWQVALLLANADKLPAAVKTSLSQP